MVVSSPETQNFIPCGVLRKMTELGYSPVEKALLPDNENNPSQSMGIGVLPVLELIRSECTLGQEFIDSHFNETLATNRATFEYELEKERRIVVSVDQGVLESSDNWENRFTDTYDQSGRFRIREKNGQLRMSVKIPLFYDIDPIVKHCLRIEVKPGNSAQENELMNIRELLRRELGTQEFKKYGKKITLTNGNRVWINTNDNNEYWIESDTEDQRTIEEFLPEGIHYSHDEISKVEIHQNALEVRYRDDFLANLSKTSRTVAGSIDTSVAEVKSSLLENNNSNTAHIVEANERKLFDFLWTNSSKHFDNPVTVLSFIDDIAKLVNDNLVTVPLAWRRWDVKYGRGVKASELGKEMMDFARDFIDKYSELSDEEGFVRFAGWLELQIDRHLHPYIDGCGRISKALSAWLLMSRGLPLPDYVDRELYYASMNQGDEAFMDYFHQAYDGGKTAWMTT